MSALTAKLLDACADLRLTPLFQESLLTLEESGARTWEGYNRLGTQLYTHCEALWAVYGRKDRHHEQAFHLEIASAAFGEAIRLIEASHDQKDLNVAFQIDVLRCMQAVVDASFCRLHSDVDGEELDTANIIAAVIGTEESNGIVDHCLDRPRDTAPRRQATAIVYALGFKLACGKALGFLSPFNAAKAEALLTDALALFDPRGIEGIDKSIAYRGLLFDAALEAASRHDTTMMVGYCTLALKSARKHGSRKDARRARLIRWFGAAGNRWHFAIYLRKHPQG